MKIRKKRKYFNEISTFFYEKLIEKISSDFFQRFQRNNCQSISHFRRKKKIRNEINKSFLKQILAIVKKESHNCKVFENIEHLFT